MSSHNDEVDVDIDVVSSPEPSGANTTDDESPSYPKRSKLSPSPITSNAAVTLAASLLTTTANFSPSTLHNLQSHSAQLLNNQYHSHISNSLLNSNKENNISDCSRLSPPRTPETNNNNINSKLSPTTTPHTGFTSFSISSILSRQDSPNSKKIIAPIPSFPINGSQDAAMISR